MTRFEPSSLISRLGKTPEAFLLAAAAGIVYAWTLLPGVGYHGDTANLQFVGYVLGTTHPTGYPLYTALNSAFLHLLPVGSLAYRANLLSAVFGVLAVLVLYRVILRLFADRLAAFVGAGAFAFTPVFWSQCVVAEVYSLHALLMAGVIFFAVRWAQTRRRRDIVLGGAVYALAFGHHLTCVMLLPALVFIVAATDWRAALDWKIVLPLLATAALAALQYGYLFWRYYDPGTPYLEMAVPTMERLVWYLRGAQFQDRMWAFTFQQALADRLPMFIRLAFQQFGILILVAALGAFAFPSRRLGLFFFLYFAANTLWALNYDIPDIAVYFIPSFLVCAVWLGAGVAWLRRRWPLRPWVWGLAVLLPLWFLWRNLDGVSQRHNVEIEHQVKGALEAAGDNALIVSPDYHYSEYFWYFLLGEGLEKERGIYLMHHFDAGQVRDYLLHAAPIYLPTERKTAPPALKPFFFMPAAGQARFFGEDKMNQLDAAGLALEPVTEQLFRIRPKN